LPNTPAVVNLAAHSGIGNHCKTLAVMKRISIGSGVATLTYPTALIHLKGKAHLC
jgi:hypothetical protein